MFSFANPDAFDPLLWSGMLVLATLAVLGLTSWFERRTRHGHRRHDRGATPSVR